MTHAHLSPWYRNWRTHAGEASGPAPCSKRIPVSAYTDQQRFEQEREKLFLRRPLIIGHESQIPNPG